MISVNNISYTFPWLFVFYVLLFCAIPICKKDFYTKSLTPNKFTQYYIVFAILFIFIGLRGFLLTDFVNYYPYYEKSPTFWDSFDTVSKFLYNSEYSSWEKGFLLLTCFVKSVCPNYFFFQCILYLIDFAVLYKFLKLYLGNYFILGFCFFFVFDGLVIEMNLFRNQKSIMLFLISLGYLGEKKYIKYLLLNILGFLFHASAVFYILLTPFYCTRFPRKIILLLWFTGIAFFFFHIEWCTQFLYAVSTFLPGRMSYLIKIYININTASFGLSIGFLERAMTFIFMYQFAFIKHNYYETRINTVFYNAMFLYLFLYLYFTELPIVQGRIGSLFVFAYWILYPKLYEKMNNKFIFIVIFALYSGFKILSGYSINLYCWDSALYLNYDFNARKQSVELFFKKVKG